MAKAQDADPVRNVLGATDACEVTVEAGLKQSFFGSQIRQPKLLLQAVNAQHHCQVKRRTSRLGQRCVQCNQRQRFAPRHDMLHLVEQDLLARAPGTEVQAKIFLFHAINACNLRAPDPTGWRESFEHDP